MKFTQITKAISLGLLGISLSYCSSQTETLIQEPTDEPVTPTITDVQSKDRDRRFRNIKDIKSLKWSENIEFGLRDIQPEKIRIQSQARCTSEFQQNQFQKEFVQEGVAHIPVYQILPIELLRPAKKLDGWRLCDLQFKIFSKSQLLANVSINDIEILNSDSFTKNVSGVFSHPSHFLYRNKDFENQFYAWERGMAQFSLMCENSKNQNYGFNKIQLVDLFNFSHDSKKNVETCRIVGWKENGELLVADRVFLWQKKQAAVAMKILSDFEGSPQLNLSGLPLARIQISNPNNFSIQLGLDSLNTNLSVMPIYSREIFQLELSHLAPYQFKAWWEIRGKGWKTGFQNKKVIQLAPNETLNMDLMSKGGLDCTSGENLSQNQALVCKNHYSFSGFLYKVQSPLRFYLNQSRHYGETKWKAISTNSLFPKHHTQDYQFWAPHRDIKQHCSKRDVVTGIGKTKSRKRRREFRNMRCVTL